MSHEPLPYNDYGCVMRNRFGARVQKLSVDAALVCPNRSGEGSRGGCTFCLNEAFSPAYCGECSTIDEQLRRGIEFHAARGRAAKHYLAYFQSGTNTNASVEELRRLFEPVVENPAISGIIVGTRPDAVSSEKLDLLADFSRRKYVAVEYGIESTCDATLCHVNRGHGFDIARWAVTQTRERGIGVGAHFILGLPHESREQMVAQTTEINSLGLNYIKFHQLQIFRSTPMAEEWTKYPERFLFSGDFTPSDYIELCVDILRRLDPAIAVDRLFAIAPRHLTLYSPLGGVRPDELRQRLIERMRRKGFMQGDLFVR